MVKRKLQEKSNLGLSLLTRIYACVYIQLQQSATDSTPPSPYPCFATSFPDEPFLFQLQLELLNLAD